MSSAADDFAAWQQGLLRSLAKLSNAAQFVSANEVLFLKSSSSETARSIDDTSDSLLATLARLTAYAGMSAASAGEAASLPAIDADSLTDRFDAIVDVVDNLLEKTDVLLDSQRKPAGKLAPSVQVAPGAPAATPGAAQAKHRAAPGPHAILRPQLHFLDKVDNSYAPFVPKITFKPNARTPLNLNASSMSSELETHLSTLGDAQAAQSAGTLHPYRFEIENIEYPQSLFEQRPEILYRTLSATPLTWVATVEQLETMCSILDAATEIAVDLEHHDYRSFQGFTCLIQISTRSEDFVVDALSLRSYLHLLNSSFTNPSIVKVFHGAEMDIQWLQRDFGVYVVGLFDTFHASNVLELEGHSLAFLLKLYCSVTTDKRYQLADWRIRPLSDEMLLYARTDTHYLLYIFDRMRNEILARCSPDTHNLMRVTLERSAQTSLNVYQKDVYSDDGLNPTGWRTLLNRTKESLNEESLAVFKALHSWRDHTARKEDESLRFVLPNHMLMTLSRVMPTDSSSVIGCCVPTPTLVRVNAKDLATLIQHTLQETRQTSAARKAELTRLNAEIEATRRAMNEKLAASRTHLRFDGNAAEPAAAAAAASRAAPSDSVITAASQGLRAEPRERRALLKDIAVTPSSQSRLFGDATLVCDQKESRALAEAQKKAAAIRSTLALQAPSFVESLKRKSTDETLVLAPATAVASAPASVPNTATTPSTARDSPLADSPADAAPAPPKHTIIVLDGDDEPIEALHVSRPQSKKAKKRKVVNPALGKAGKDGGDDFAPFDYSSEPIVLSADAEDGESDRKNGKGKEFAPFQNIKDVKTSHEHPQTPVERILLELQDSRPHARLEAIRRLLLALDPPRPASRASQHPTSRLPKPQGPSMRGPPAGQHKSMDREQEPACMAPTSSEIARILEMVPYCIRSEHPELAAAAIDLLLLVLSLDSDIAREAPGSGGHIDDPDRITGLFLDLVPVLIAVIGDLSQAHRDRIVALFVKLMASSDCAQQLVGCIVLTGLGSDSWRTRIESIRVIEKLFNKDSGGISVPDLVAGLTARLRDVSELVSDEAARALAHVMSVIGEDQLLATVAGLPRISKQIFAQHRDAIQRHAQNQNQHRREPPGLAAPSHASTTQPFLTSQLAPETSFPAQPLGSAAHSPAPAGASLTEPTAFGFAPAASTALLCSKDADWKSRAAAIEAVYSASCALQPAELIPHLANFVDFAIPLLEDSNFKIALTAIHIVGQVVASIGPDVKPIAQKLVIALSSKLSDSKIAIRQLCARLLTQIMQATSPRFVHELMLAHLNSDNARVREELINVLSASLLVFPNQDLDLEFLAPHLVAALRDARAKVRYVTVEACAILACRLTAPRLIERLRTSGLDFETVELLQLRFADPVLPHLAPDGSIEHIISRSSSGTPAFQKQVVYSERASQQAGDQENIRQNVSPSELHEDASILSAIDDLMSKVAYLEVGEKPLGLRDRIREQPHQPQAAFNPAAANALPMQVVSGKTVPKKGDAPAAKVPAPARFGESDVKALMEHLRSTQEWNVLTDAMTGLREKLPNHPAVFSAFGHELAILLVANVQNLRTTVARLAIQCLRDLLRYAAKSLETDLDLIVSSLMRKIGEGNAFIIEEIDHTLNTICEQYAHTRVLSTFVCSADHKNPLVRLRVAVVMDRIFSGLSPQQTSRLLQSIRDTEKLLPALVHFTREGLADTRNAAKHAVFILARNPDFERVLVKVLNANQASEIRECVRSYVPKPEVLQLPAAKAAAGASQPKGAWRPGSSRLGGHDAAGAAAAAGAGHPVAIKTKTQSSNERREDSEELQATLRDMASDGKRAPACVKMREAYGVLTSAAADWRVRCVAVDSLASFVKSHPKILADRPQMQLVFDVLTERCHDGNSKVGVAALKSLGDMMPVLGATIDMTVPSLVPVVANQMVASNPQIRAAACGVMNELVETADATALIQSLATIASYGTNAKVKSLVIETLTTALDRTHAAKSSLLTKHVVPCCVKLMAENRGEIRRANRSLLRKLQGIMGDELQSIIGEDMLMLGTD
ncbi:exosome nuclease subunit [Polyrhizophydium stewartii]|uniref:Exosome nuclease subunit n=1 Tax=Polyrhizophydium stewartii TaxID=2732419 RepID=A0ABR4NJM9_9FUNG